MYIYTSSQMHVSEAVSFQSPKEEVCITRFCSGWTD